MDSCNAALPGARDWADTRGFMVRPTAIFGVMLGLSACFTGNFLMGQPCASDADCGPSLACTEGFCGGPLAGSSTTTGESVGTTTTTAVVPTTAGDTSTGGTTTSGTSTGDPTTGIVTTEDSSTGPTCGYGRCTDIDLVVIVDNSPSMVDKGDALLAALVSFQTYIQPELAQACSVHLGVTTTDIAYANNPVECQRAGALVQANFNGEACMTAEGHPYATLEDLDNPAPLLCLIQVGAMGSINEKPVEAMFELFNTTVNAEDKCNEGFVRQDSQMVIVMATDEDDDDADPQGNNGSVQPSTIWHGGLIALKPEEDLLMIGLLGDTDQATTMCPWDPFTPPDGIGAEASPKLQEFFASFPPDHSVVGSLCQPSEAGIYDPFMMEVQMKLRTMCGV